MAKFLIYTVLFLCCSNIVSKAQRVVAVGSGINEIVYALGASDKLVGNCVSSIYPEDAKTLPKVGYKRMLPSEGIISLKPDLVIMTDEAGPPSVVNQLDQLKIDVIKLSANRSLQNIYDSISVIAEALGKEKESFELIQHLSKQEDELKLKVAALNDQPTVLFILGHGGVARVAGYDTAADSMIKLAGGQNVFSEFKGYKPVSPEEIIKMNPDYILATNMGVDQQGGIQKFSQMNGVRDTPAARNQNILIFNSQYLLGFGPRTITAAIDLNSHFDR
ncbi:MAG TPA: hemin ABC transporter substrate-binding protein [Verrucomicrobia bacterium]|nr:hemin ABC transporter substrate-binding protein [Kiritimatiellaceae bacterium]HBO87465.1 hemin ABC transporter substrate-binding protein [Verrucomicrobiota bacterium]|tara:strand:- start:161 stop:988 length:828 start_codon:yes stop_codon:yes gene_type:complete